jgi:hypothetical protein
MGKRLVLAALVSTALAALVASGASARTAFTSYSFNATGVETSVPVNNVSTFSGGAVGTGGIATWSASVPHDPLVSCGGPTNGVTDIVPGGSFSLTGTLGVKLNGSFTGGTVTAPAGCVSGACGNETFSINATLAINGQPAVITGSLNHFSTMILGSCVTYFATISGHLQVPSS